MFSVYRERYTALPAGAPDNKSTDKMCLLTNALRMPEHGAISKPEILNVIGLSSQVRSKG